MSGPCGVNALDTREEQCRSTVRVLYMYCETWALGLYLVFVSGIREPRGFGFVQFLEENRKKPTDMRTRERRGCNGRFNDRRRSPPRYSRSPPPRYSRSPPLYARSRSNSREYSPPLKRKQHVRSISPGEKRHSRERSYSRSPPPARGRSPRPRSPVVDNRSPPYNGSRSPSPLPPRERSRSPVRERARASRDPSRSPIPRDYSPSP
ncbi:hypothetical protein Tco_1201754 [Tanacetum coccineum]